MEIMKEVEKEIDKRIKVKMPMAKDFDNHFCKLFTKLVDRKLMEILAAGKFTDRVREAKRKFYHGFIRNFKFFD